MDNYQKVEQLVSKTGSSYEDAKAALESCGWDMLDAVISLEREGKINKETSEQTAQKAEEPIEIIPEVTYFHDDGAEENREKAGKDGNTKGSSKREHKLWDRIKGILMNNRMVILKNNGRQIADLPILIPIIALIAFFWATMILAVVAILFGCRFHFEGQDLGKTNINNTMDKASDYAEKVRNDLSGRVNDKQNTDN